MLTFHNEASAASLLFKEVLFRDAIQDTYQVFLETNLKGGKPMFPELGGGGWV